VWTTLDTEPRQYSVTRFLEKQSIMGLTAIRLIQIKHRLNWAMIFTVTATSEGLFAQLEGYLCHPSTIIIVLHWLLARYFEPLIVYIFRFPE